MELLNQIITDIDDLPAWVNALTGVVAASTAVTILTPTKTDDKIANTVLGALNFLAGNFGKNTNADAE